MTSQVLWERRHPRAAFYSSYNEVRRLVWDQAALRPDLIDAPLHLIDPIHRMPPWKARSREPR